MVTNFTLSVEDYRKDKSGSKRRFSDNLDFQAWASGAEAIVSTCRAGTIIAVECVARYDECYDYTYFRIKTFKVLN